MPAEIRTTVSLTEVPQFRRLVQFLYDVEEIAGRRDDVELQDLVDFTRDDLEQQQ